MVSELPERFFAAEIVREKILLQYGQEIPYVTQVQCSERIEPESSILSLLTMP